MKTEELEKFLQDIKFHHVTDNILIAYRDLQLDNISREQIKTHLDLCLICERRFQLFEEEQAVLQSYKASAADIALAKQVLGHLQPTVKNALRERLAKYLKPAAAGWQVFTRQLVSLGDGKAGGVELWRWQSEQGVFVAYARLQPNGDLTLHFSSRDMSLEGAQLKIKAGKLSLNAILERLPESESELYAEIRISSRQRPKNLTSISIE